MTEDVNPVVRMREIEVLLNKALDDAMAYAKKHGLYFSLVPKEGPLELYFNGDVANEEGWDSSSANC